MILGSNCDGDNKHGDDDRWRCWWRTINDDGGRRWWRTTITIT